MSSVSWESEPDLRRPLLVVAFAGWFDAGDAATWAVRLLKEHHEAQLLARIDPEEFFNFQTTRPTVAFNDAGDREVSWPENDCYWAKADSHDLVLLSGVEPHLRWKGFSQDLVDIAKKIDAEMVVTLGALVDVVPHTRPPVIKGSATNPELATRLALDRPTYQGPTGLVGVLHDSLDKASVPVISLRAAVPHYVSGTPNPIATQSLLRRFEGVTGVPAPADGLDEAVSEWRERVDAAVADDPEVAGYVKRVEAQMQEPPGMDPNDLPTGDDLAAQFEEFLREQRGE